MDAGLQALEGGTYDPKNGKPRNAYLSGDTIRISAEHRTRVVSAHGAIGTNVFVHAGKGPSRAGGSGEFNETWRGACRRAGYTDTLLHDLRRPGGCA
jgi:hypothetical protein